ncbi:hypothetical protein COF68_05185 [Bacillus toyonensis]|uniref:hypothetical protein n=1 Tax=Bacillus toyonensis TaxID=155322 RepID=UPI000BFCD361|nr:hypothetical protein [Bacillus toyonensis]PHE64238.1 hypothetical protein COF68_05185 [Bacillus toyonensis]
MLTIQKEFIGDGQAIQFIRLLDTNGKELAFFHHNFQLNDFIKKTGTKLSNPKVSYTAIGNRVEDYETNKVFSISHIEDINSLEGEVIKCRGIKGSSVVDMALVVYLQYITWVKPILLSNVPTYNETEGNYFEFVGQHGSFYVVA